MILRVTISALCPAATMAMGDFLHVDQLAPEIGVFGQMRVGLIKIALRVEKQDVHL